ncbi:MULTISPECIES: hypothetical protein [Paenibacillus]|uniref:hypothetical protein n=1 Tax=Paenibacillus TaxID=44249 RepID=UPI0022B8D746|nr:hypothetical protein [Paenibacillus caseinilyticus]MCZ8520285.1 hypothetical protein [Paenibacillus caseinilyticus]
MGSNPDIAQVAALIADPSRSAGQVGIALTEHWIALGWLEAREGDFHLTPQGMEGFGAWGLETRRLTTGRRHVARKCLDWSERKYHVAGKLGEAVAHKLFELGWIQRKPKGRAVTVTEQGWLGLFEVFGLEPWDREHEGWM